MIISKLHQCLIPVKRNSRESEHAGSNRDVGYEVAELTITHAEHPVTVDNQGN